MRPRKLHLIALVLILACLIGAVGSSQALAVIVKGDGPEGDGTNNAAFTTPGSPYFGMTTDYVYRYGTATGDTKRNGSMVAIGYFSLITARHFGPNTGDKFTIDGDQFQVTAVQSPPPDAGQTYSADLDILTVLNLTHPNRPLPGFYQVRQAAPYSNQNAIIVGTGYGGSIVSDLAGGWKVARSTVAPYLPLQVGPQVLRWGTNKYTYTSILPSVNIGPPNSVISASTKCFRMAFEGIVKTDSALGSGDSGGGVFFKDSATGTWQLGGINLYLGWTSFPDDSIAASLYTYNLHTAANPNGWINGILGLERLPGDADRDEDVDARDYIVLKDNYGRTGMSWEQGDFSGDGVVNRTDLSIFELNFGYVSPRHVYNPLDDGYSIGPGGLVPEPASLALLAAGMVGLVVRRRRERGAPAAAGR